MSLFTFDQGIEDGLGAGSYPDDGILDCTVGLNCSGFVSQAWQTGHYTTSSMHCAYPGDEDLPFCNPNVGGEVCIYGDGDSFCSIPCAGAGDCDVFEGGCCADLGDGEMYCLTADFCGGDPPDPGSSTATGGDPVGSGGAPSGTSTSATSGDGATSADGATVGAGAGSAGDGGGSAAGDDDDDDDDDGGDDDGGSSESDAATDDDGGCAVGARRTPVSGAPVLAAAALLGAAVTRRSRRARYARRRERPSRRHQRGGVGHPGGEACGGGRSSEHASRATFAICCLNVRIPDIGSAPGTCCCPPRRSRRADLAASDAGRAARRRVSLRAPSRERS